MLGKKSYKPKLFYTISLEELVPAGHDLRQILRVVDVSFVRSLVKERYSYTGQPSVDPEVIVKLLFLGYYYSILSERQLAKRVETDLAFRWFLGYDLDEKVPTHSVLSKARDRYGVEIFQNIFDRIVEQCIKAGLVEGKQAFMDATLIDADASEKSFRPRLKILTAKTYAKEMLERPEEEPEKPKASPKKLTINEKKVSSTDPDATMHKKRGGKGAGLKYSGHYLVDSKRRVIVGAAASDTTKRADDQVAPLILGAKFRHKLRFSTFCADSEYGTQDIYHFAFSEGITPYLPPQMSHKKPSPFSKDKFSYDANRDRYRCPQGYEMVRKRYIANKQYIEYGQDVRGACQKCHWQKQCTPGRYSRILHRLLYQKDVDRGRALAKTTEYKRQMSMRKHVIESLFGEAKVYHGLRRARFRGLQKVKIQVLWTATVLNIKRLVRYGRVTPGLPAVPGLRQHISAGFIKLQQFLTLFLNYRRFSVETGI